MSELPPNPFSQEMPQNPQPQMQQVQQPPPKYEVPVELVSLPSQGLIYPLGHPLCNEKAVEIRCLNASDENLLSSKALIKKGTVLSTLLKSCILNKTIDPDTMLSGDRNAILIGLRVTGYGVDYSARVSCPKCDKEFENNFSLGLLKLKTLKVAPLAPNTNLFSFRLPMGGQEVYFKLLTAADEAEITSIIDGQKKLNMQIENLVTTRLAQSIVAVNGERDRGKIIKFVNMMPAGDARALRKYINEIEPSVDMTQKITCQNPDCLAESEVVMPLGANFFWPDLRI